MTSLIFLESAVNNISRTLSKEKIEWDNKNVFITPLSIKNKRMLKSYEC